MELTEKILFSNMNKSYAVYCRAREMVFLSFNYSVLENNPIKQLWDEYKKNESLYNEFIKKR